ncbi:recombinase RecT [Pseudomonas sp. ITA]|uniref:RecT family recombinase n=1 Tax=Pseudomonas sp. ITA TaxID=2825841 RepID=UPI002496E2B0|nr:RecT family recombinase [Pseudomonas sp. ITA]MDI2144950.1 recombinase RecT [Pseudomonas sp. ITA]
MAGKQISQQRPPVKPEQINDLVRSTEQDFSNIVSAMNSRMNFAQEALYAYQAMLGNSYLASVAMNNKASFALAMQQIASSGLTLNPAMGLAYLVPREGKVIADISYRGLMKIATDSRAVDLVVACSVYSRDTFSFNGANDEPIHIYDPFLAKQERGEFRGVYVKAYLSIGKLLVHPVSAEDVYAARQLSSAWTNSDPTKKKGPWDTHFDSMAIKTGIKIARKYWPMTSPALDNVISYLNEEGGEGFVGGAVTLETASREMHGPSSATQTNVVNLHEGVVYDTDPNPGGHPQADASPVGDSRHSQMDQPRNQGPIRTEGEVGVGSAPRDVNETLIRRIDQVHDRSMRTGAWQSAFDWAAAQLKGDLLVRANEKFRKGQSEYLAKQKVSA